VREMIVIICKWEQREAKCPRSINMGVRGSNRAETSP
jgi:hypothetical protein